ncbi:MAG: DUF4105 domain-containing protein [Oligoflexia bacterium]|nr:DUF4105 domain-containing protein [Oligoflexia bacterium]
MIFFLIAALFFNLFFFTSSSFASAYSVYENIEWLNLLHYKKRYSKYESEVDGKDFFFSNEGKTDSLKELQATIENFKRDKYLACKFPARFKWLKAMGIIKFPFLDKSEKSDSNNWCIKYFDFLERMHTESVSVVFSSYYINNPASTFGHTFLRLNKNKNNQTSHQATKADELLDYAINFGADITTSNPIIYALGGLSGYFKGTFSAIPYFYKVREYNDYESRDLISYELNLSAKEIERLLDHIWELGHTYFDYYFLSENCSYHILTLLEAAKPDLKLTENLPFYVIPSDTIKALFLNAGLVKNITFRPSIHTRFNNSLKILSKDEKKILQKILKNNNPDLIDEINLINTSKVKILDSALDYFDFKYFKKLLKGDNETLKLKIPYLLKRGSIPIASSSIQLPETDEQIQYKLPNKGHGSRRVSVAIAKTGSGMDYSKYYLQFEYKNALHDILDKVDGYPKNVSLNIGIIDFRLGYDQTHKYDGKFYLNKLQLFEILTLNPLNEMMLFSSKNSFWYPSWGGSFGYKKVGNYYSLIGFDGSIGLSVNLFNENILLYGLLNFDLAFDCSESKNFMPGVGPVLATKIDLNKEMIIKISYQEMKYFKNGSALNIYDSSFQLRWNTTKNFSLALEINSINSKERSFPMFGLDKLKSAEYILRYLYYF